MTLSEVVSSNEYDKYKRIIDQLDAPLVIIVHIDNLLDHLKRGNLKKKTFEGLLEKYERLYGERLPAP